MEIKFDWKGTAAVFVVAFVIYVIKLRDLKKKDDPKYESKQKAKIGKQFVFFYTNVLTRKAFRHVVERMTSLNSMSIDELKKLCVTCFRKTVIVALCMPLYALLTNQDFFNVMLAILVSYIYYQATMERVYDKEIANMTEEAVFTIQSVADNYALTHDVAKSLKLCSRAGCLNKIITGMYDVLMSEDRDNEMYKYKSVVPIRVLGALATTCFITAEEGDVREPSGEWKFIAKLTQLRLEADSKVRNLTATDIAFNTLSTLSLTGVVAAPIINWFLLSQLPGTAVYIKGMYGMLEKAILIIMTFVAYYVIAAYRRPSVVNQVDKSELIDRISKVKKVRKFVQTLIPKSYKAERKWSEKINNALSSKDMNYIYTLKLMTSSLMFVAAVIASVMFVVTAKISLWNNYKSLGVVNYTAEMTEKRVYQIKQMDKLYMTTFPEMDSDTARKLVRARVPDLTPLDLEQQVDRLHMKYTRFYKLGFKWYYWLIIYAFGVVGWYVPEAMLFLRKKLVVFEAVDDAMQLQSLMITLQGTQYNVRRCLYWLAQEATIHKQPLWRAYVEYASDPEMALIKLKDSVGLKDVKRLVAKLEKSMYDMTVREAFRDIALDKQQALSINEMLQKQTLEYKTQTAKRLASLPLNFAILGGAVAPILIIGFVQLKDAIATLT